MNNVVHIKIEPDLLIDENHNCTFIKSKFLLEIKTEPKTAEPESKSFKNDDEKSKCNQCGAMFKYKSQIKRHMIQVHTQEKPFKCDICQETFVDKYYVRNHMQKHSGIKLYQCKICAKPFAHPFNIKKHMLVHTGLRPYKCLKCTRTYKHSSHLKRHQIHHEDGKNHLDTRPVQTEKITTKKCEKFSPNVPVIDVMKELSVILS